jgi:hypothetical protein
MGNEKVKKKCRACLEIKDLCEFGVNNGYKDGLQTKCKECYRVKKPLDKKADLVGEIKKCEVCLEEKDLFYFYKRPNRSYTHEPRCIQCTKEGKLIDKKVFKEDKKKCSMCEEYKTFDNYQRCSSCINSITPHCKDCSKIKNKNYMDSLSDDIKKERKRTEYLKNKEGYLRRAKEYSKNNKDYIALQRREYEKSIKYKNPLLHIKRNIRALIKTTFTRSIVEDIIKAKKTVNILGCTFEEFKNYIESQFEDWMNWDNYGNVCETLEPNCSWDLDHIIPISLAETEEDIYMLNHWSNFQPLCSYKNRNIKRDNIYPCTNLELKITLIEDIIIKNE